MKPLISVIVPVFNAQTYLSQTINSILLQSLTNFELIMVNDGSTDSSVQILKDAQLKDSRIRVLDQKNAGVSAARNQGLKEVCGDYFVFVDADDVLHHDFLNLLYQQVELNQADLVSCDCIRFSQNEQPIFKQYKDKHSHYLSKKQSLHAFFLDQVKPDVWCRLYHTQSFIDVRFVEGVTCAEDALYSFQCLLRVRKHQIIDDALYGYRKHPDSVMACYNHKKTIDVLNILNTIYMESKLGSWYHELSDSIDVFLINHAVNYRYTELLNAPYYDWDACETIRQALQTNFVMTKERMQKARLVQLTSKVKKKSHKPLWLAKRLFLFKISIFLGPEWLAKYLFLINYNYKSKRRHAKLNKT